VQRREAVGGRGNLLCSSCTLELKLVAVATARLALHTLSFSGRCTAYLVVVAHTVYINSDELLKSLVCMLYQTGSYSAHALAAAASAQLILVYSAICTSSG
jgi:hypothetical protein